MLERLQAPTPEQAPDERKLGASGGSVEVVIHVVLESPVSNPDLFLSLTRSSR
jgi:hypothetical protein